MKAKTKTRVKKAKALKVNAPVGSVINISIEVLPSTKDKKDKVARSSAPRVHCDAAPY